MKRPDPVLPQGTRVRTHDTLDPTEGLHVQPEHLRARTAGTSGTICGVVGVPWGDVYLISHAGAEVSAAYRHTEFELENEPEDQAKSAVSIAA
jgi:hypothetical protein